MNLSVLWSSLTEKFTEWLPILCRLITSLPGSSLPSTSLHPGLGDRLFLLATLIFTQQKIEQTVSWLTSRVQEFPWIRHVFSDNAALNMYAFYRDLMEGHSWEELKKMRSGVPEVAEADFTAVMPEGAPTKNVRATVDVTRGIQ